MKMMSKQEKEKFLSRLYWDKNMAPGEILQLLEENFEGNRQAEKINLYCRLLKSYDWYILLKLVPNDSLRDMLSESVIQCLHPKELRDRYFYAGKVLSE